MLDRAKPRRGRPTSSQLAERKERVLAVAAELFLTNGFADSTVAEIAERSGVSPRMITAHFGEKADIFAAIIRETNSQFMHELALPSSDVSLDGALLSAAHFAMRMAYSDRSIKFQRMVLGSASRFADITAEIARQSSRDFFEMMEAVFADLIARGLITDGDPARLAKYFVDLIVGFALIQAGMGYWERVSDEAELRDKIAFFCNSLRSA